MPELPEVETIVNDLKKLVIGKTITDIWVDTPKIIKHPDLKTLAQQIKGLKIKDISRQGKNIIFDLSKNYSLLIHQKLTGHLLYGKWTIKRKRVVPLIAGRLSEPVNNYIHLIIFLNNGYQIALSDLRKFAKVIFDSTEKIKNLKELQELGPDPLAKDFTEEKLKEILKNKKGKIKQVLMDQTVIAGIGNIYSDEILWWAQIHPLRSTQSLTNEEIHRLYHYIKEVLATAIKTRGASVSDYRDPKGEPGHYDQIRRVYRRENQKCYRCGTLIKRIKVGSRSSCFCPNCQKL